MPGPLLLLLAQSPRPPLHSAGCATGRSRRYRIDRFTLRAPFEIDLGSRIPIRSGPKTVHVVDLTDTYAMSETHRARVARAQMSLPVSLP